MLRLRFCSPENPERSFVLKKVRLVEGAVHRLVSGEIEGLTVKIVGQWSTGESELPQEFLLLQEAAGRDHMPDGYRLRAANALPNSAVISRDKFRQALQKLARVHARFHMKSAELSRLEVRPAGIFSGSGVGARDRCAAIALYADVLGLAGERAVISAIAEMGPVLEEQARFLSAEEAVGTWTLLHGDFHAGNIALASDLSVRILDWGEAKTGVPAWDLISCGEEEVDWYWQALQSYGFEFQSEGQFHRQLRAAVICRMWEFLETAIGGVLLGGNVDLSAALPACVERLLEAAGSPAFRGGRGMEFGAGEGA